ncbi:MAG: hypothetical protein C4539_03995 [Ignavibacteriales bacterium]|nr:MAG: hypothetical protein C4539_03995 [Ignavibacteriales bacterium]
MEVKSKKRSNAPDKIEEKDQWTKPLKITAVSVIVTFLGVICSIILGFCQLSQTNKIASNEREIKMIETFKSLLNIDYKEEVWKYEGSIRMLGGILKSESKEDTSLKVFAKLVFCESVTTTIAQFHRTEDIRLNAARVIALMYHIDKKYIIKKLIDEIKPETYPAYYCVNGGVIVALARIPDYWEGTIEQYNKVKQLNSHQYLGEKDLTAAYKRGWLNGEALVKWKQVY